MTDRRPYLDSIVCTVYDRFDDLEPLREEWDRFVLDSTGDLYQSFDWCRLWWKYYGKGRELAVLVFRKGGSVVGILPLGVDPLRVGPIRVRIAKLLNSEYTACILHPAVLPEAADAVFEKMLDVLFNERRCDLLLFGQISEEFEGIDSLKHALDRPGFPCSLLSETAVADHAFFQLTTDWIEYFNTLKSKQRTNLRRRLRMIEEDFGPVNVVNLTTEEEILREFPRFRMMHDRYWLSQGQGGHFVDLVRGEEFNLDLIRACAPLGRVTLQRLEAGETILGYQYLFEAERRIHCRLTAREVGEEWSRLGVGVIGLQFLLEDSIRRGFRTIEAGPGLYDYKESMGGTYRVRRSLLAGRNTGGGRLKLHAVRGLHRFLDVFYYKIWYQRLVKVLGMNRGSIWQSYLRSRL